MRERCCSNSDFCSMQRMVRNMISIDGQKRLRAEAYLSQYKGDHMSL